MAGHTGTRFAKLEAREAEYVARQLGFAGLQAALLGLRQRGYSVFGIGQKLGLSAGAVRYRLGKGDTA